MGDDSFASLLEGSPGRGGSRRLRAGEVVEARVLTIAGDTVFVDLGTPGDGRIVRAELQDEKGNLRVKVGDALRATVVDPRPDGPILTVSLGRGGSLDVSSLELARESGVAVAGEVRKAVKGGLEVSLGGVHAFCPASQVEIGFAADLEVYVGQTLEFRVLEIREGGRSIVVSRRSLLEERRREATQSLRETLVVGTDVTGVVHSLTKHGAVVDLGGVEGFVHVSELAGHRVERAEDILKIGESITARVLSVEDHPKGLRVRLSLRALAPETAPSALQEEVLKGTVSAANQGGLIISTPQGEGFLPLRELGLPPGADHRRAYPPGKELTVVVTSNAGGKLRFSATQVSRVEERKNYKDYSAGGCQPSAGSLGSLGDLLRERFGLPAPAAPAPAAPAPSAAARSDARTESSEKPRQAAPAPAAPAPAAAKPPVPPAVDPATPEPQRPPGSREDLGGGVVRRRR